MAARSLDNDGNKDLFGHRKNAQRRLAEDVHSLPSEQVDIALRSNDLGFFRG